LTVTRLSVRWRLQLGFGLLVALLVALAAGSVWQLRSMGLQIERIVEGHNHRSDLAHRLNAAQLEWMERLRALLTVSDPEDQKAQQTELLAAQRRYVDAETALAKALTDGSDGAAALQDQLKEVQGLREAISPAYDAATRSALNGAGTEGALALLLPAEATEVRWRQQIGAMVDAAADASRAEFEAARRRQRVAMLAVAGTAAAAVLVALVMAASLVRSITRPVSAAVFMAEAIAQGRLDGHVEVQRHDEFGRLATAMATMQQRLRDSVLALRQSSDAVLYASNEIGAGSRHLSTRTEQAAAQLDATNASVQRLTEALASSVQAARSASTLAGSARSEAQQGDAAVARLMAQMQHVAVVAQRITEIVKVIDGLAFRTNLLALNASVEAARAGEQGRGFAIVAAEVRALAQQSAEAAGQIRALSDETSSSITQGALSVREAGATVNRLVETADAVARTIEGVATTSAQQSDVLTRVDGTLVQLDSATQQNSALAEELAAAAMSLQGRAQELRAAMGGFHLGGTEEVEEAAIPISC
jgi:methyl-accepting chemotaxis protein